MQRGHISPSDVYKPQYASLAAAMPSESTGPTTELHEIVVTRPTTDTRLGIRLSSDSPDDLPAVKAIAGAAGTSALCIDDVIQAINGEPACNSVIATELFRKAGTEVRLSVLRRNVAGSGGETLSKDVTIARNALGLGLVVDSANRISSLLEGAAAALHGEFAVGQVITAVNGQPLPPGAPLAPYIPPGSKPFTLRLSAAPPSGKPTAAGGVPSGVLTSDAGKPRLSRRASSARRLSDAQKAELADAFELLGDFGDTPPHGSDNVRVGPDAVFAAMTHFDRSISRKAARDVCCRVSQRADGLLSFAAFCDVIKELATMANAAALLEAVDAKGAGCVSTADAQRAIAALARGDGSVRGAAATLPPPSASDVAAMLAVLQPTSNGIVQREKAVHALHAALSEAGKVM